MNLSKIKKLIENNPVAFATVMNNKNPNIIGVSSVKVIGDKEILITDNYMNQTTKDISKNNNTCLLVWNKHLKGYKLIGKAKYYKTGKWKKFVEKMKENKGFPTKGAVVIKISKIIPSR